MTNFNINNYKTFLINLLKQCKTLMIKNKNLNKIPTNNTFNLIKINKKLSKHNKLIKYNSIFNSNSNCNINNKKGLSIIKIISSKITGDINNMIVVKVIK